MDTREKILGFHQPGDYHFFIGNPVHAGYRLLHYMRPEDVELHSEEAFRSLVTTIHEHNHLLQEMFQGFCLWRYDCLTDFTSSVIQAVNAQQNKDFIEIPFFDKRPELGSSFDLFSLYLAHPLARAMFLDFEASLIDDLLISPEHTRKLLEAEVRASPTIATVLSEDAYTLTTLEMLECHAALLTEEEISELLIERPQFFPKEVIKNARRLFRLSDIEQAEIQQGKLRYSKALRCVRHILAAEHIEIQIDTERYPQCREIKDGSIYPVTMFLLDCALHVPPHPFSVVSPQPDLSSFEDMFPPTRFIKLLLSYCNLFRSSDEKVRSYLLDPHYFYSHAANLIIANINKSNAFARKEDKTEWIHGNPNLKDTFLSLEEVNRLWTDELEVKRQNQEFPLNLEARVKAIKLRTSEPHFWFSGPLEGIHSRIDLPYFYENSRGELGFKPYYKLPGGQLPEWDSSEFKTFIGSAVRAMVDWENSERLPSDSSQFSPTLVLYPFLKELIEQEMLNRFAKAIYYQGTLRCPLTDECGIGPHIPCVPRQPSCEKIKTFAALPVQRCRLRDFLEKNFGSLDKFRQNV